MTPEPVRPSRERSAATGVERFENATTVDDFLHNQALLDRNEALLRMLPADARTVVDLGCGVGTAARAIAESGRSVISLDGSKWMLRGLPPNPLCALVSALPLRARSVDAALCLEVLEHLPVPVLESTARELARVAGRWLVIGVPHRENLLRNALRCDRCGTVFNRSGHLHRFDAEALERHFPEFGLEDSWIGGPLVREYPAPLLALRHQVARKYSEMSGIEGPVCPSCHKDRFPAFRHNVLSFAFDGLNRLVSRRRPYWFIGLFQRRGGAI